MLRKLDLALIGGALSAIIASAMWLSVNYVSMLRINSIKVVAHGYFDVHILLHLGLIAVMIWLEWMVGVAILRFTFTAQFAAVFQKYRLVRLLSGPLAVAGVVLVTGATLLCAECIGSTGGPCKPDTIVYRIWRLEAFETTELQVVLLIGALALLIRMYAWLLHADEIRIVANASQ